MLAVFIFSQQFFAPPSPRVESALGPCVHRVVVSAKLDVMVKGFPGGPPAALPGADVRAQHRG